MLQIINLYGITFQPDDNTVIPVEVFNPLFNDSTDVFQELIFSAEAGLTEINKEFISFGHLVEAKTAVYEQPVKVIYRGAPFYAGIFRYKIAADKINFQLKVNFGTVALKLKNSKIRDIITLDPLTLNTDAQLEALMLDTCTNPQNYPYAFFPVKNLNWYDDGVNKPVYPWMNNWDHASQKFKKVFSRTAFDAGGTAQFPFFKISYILKKVFEYLKFNLEGELLSDPDFNSIYLYTKRPLLGNVILPCMCYLPDELTIGDFLKQIGERLKINFTYSVLNNSVTIESPLSALKVNEVEDISNYVESIQEIDTATAKGYTVTLAVDQTDNALNLETDADKDPIWKPLKTLTVGDGETILEMAAGTLKQTTGTDYSYPETDQPAYINDTTVKFNWPVRLLKFKGMQAVAGGKIYPQAYAYNLDESDSTWYRYRNESKKVILIAKIPSGVLARFKPTMKFAFKSKQNTIQRALNAKYSYALTANPTELITVTIECQTIVQDYSTPFSITDYVKEDPESVNFSYQYKFCYEDGSQPNETLNLVPVPTTGSQAVLEYTTAKAPADAGGVGGLPGRIVLKSGGGRRENNGYVLRIYDKVPKYAIITGVKFNFTQENDYYTLPAIGSSDGRPLLIVL
jgi:hypothetical protein